MDAIKSSGTVQTARFRIEYAACSHIGLRPSNQDAIWVPSTEIPPKDRGHIFAVADGMGGQRGGNIASRLACEGLRSFYDRYVADGQDLNPDKSGRHLAETIIRIDRNIRLHGIHSQLEEMGTTLSSLLLKGAHAIVAHVGDSRIYRLRKRRLTRLTVDHTFVEEMIFEGELDPKQALSHPLRHMLTRALGAGEPLPLVDTRIDSIRNRDRYLLCTDGLHNAVGDRQIKTLVSKDLNTPQLATLLVETALRNTGSDNITVVVINISG